MDKTKDLFTYCPKTNNAVKELDKYDLIEILSKCENKCSLERMRTYITDKYPQLEEHLEIFDKYEFMIYFQTRYDIVFGEDITYYMKNY
jgi:hypothetical protein